jgi:hypothetical protein
MDTTLNGATNGSVVDAVAATHGPEAGADDSSRRLMTQQPEAGQSDAMRQAEADYQVAKERCAAKADADREVCVTPEAKANRPKARANAAARRKQARAMADTEKSERKSDAKLAGASSTALHYGGVAILQERR